MNSLNDHKPTEYPCAFRDGLSFIRADNLTSKLLRVRSYLSDTLRARGGSGQNVLNQIFLARQRRPFNTEADWRRFAEEFSAWWERRLAGVRRDAAGKRWRP